jgi:hypothetical protein
VRGIIGRVVLNLSVGMLQFSQRGPFRSPHRDQVRDRYDGRLGKQEVSLTLMDGFATGNASVLERIVKATP